MLLDCIHSVSRDTCGSAHLCILQLLLKVGNLVHKPRPLSQQCQPCLMQLAQVALREQGWHRLKESSGPGATAQCTLSSTWRHGNACW